MDATREQDLITVAELYYLQDFTMESIGRRMGRSRSSVSRLLKAAREEGFVSITLNNPAERRLGLAARLQQAFGVETTVVTLTDDGDPAGSLEEVAMAAARLLGMWMNHEMVLGVAWGTTTSAISRHLEQKTAKSSVVVQLNGAANPRTSGVTYAGTIMGRFASAFDSTIFDFPVPAFFDHVETKELMWSERSIRRVLDVQAEASIALFSVGGFTGSLPSHVYSAGYLEPADIQAVKDQGVVGDVCTVMLREDGSWEDLDINRRASGPTPDLLKTLPRRLCVVSGEARARPLLAALRAGVATHLVIDELLALHLLAAAATLPHIAAS
ncbi:MAG: transcriptional regulator [Micrococcales bacterium]|nr:transcriptional regulator [Micrococcales bacterium]